MVHDKGYGIIIIKILTIQVARVFCAHKNLHIKIEKKTLSTLRVNTLNERSLKFKALSIIALSHILNTHSKSNKTVEVLSQVFITFPRSKPS